MKRILITGAYGFLERNTTKTFHDAGYNVCGLGHGKWHPFEYNQWGI